MMIVHVIASRPSTLSALLVITCRRNYDLYIGKKQFAAISGTFLAWEFELKDETGGTLALIDRNFQVCWWNTTPPDTTIV
jgi:hypothetical protein